MHTHPFSLFLWCLIGLACGIGLALFVAGPSVTPFLLASLGGTAIFLFGLTRAPAAQPRALVGGHLAAAFIGIVCYQALGESLSVYVLATVLALAFMLLTRTVHPPAGAMEPSGSRYRSFAPCGGRLESPLSGAYSLSTRVACSLTATAELGWLE